MRKMHRKTLSPNQARLESMLLIACDALPHFFFSVNIVPPHPGWLSSLPYLPSTSSFFLILFSLSLQNNGV